MAVLDIFRIADNQVMTDQLLMQYIQKNDSITNTRYRRLWRAYNGDYKIFHMPRKALYKPDNRIAVNFAQYIVDSFEGFFLGVPIKMAGSDDAVTDYITELNDSIDSDDICAELSTIVSIFGRGYRIVYVDENGEIGSAYLDPMESFAVFSEGITPRMRYFVRTYVGTDNARHGSISDETTVRYFTLQAGEIAWEEEHYHGFAGVPAVEFVQNRARRGIFETVMSLIDAYNKALSEKANDVDYFADAYLKVLGAKIDEETLRFMRENRTINVPGQNGSSVIAEFLQKPSDDDTQEHLLERIERMIFTTAMVSNISDEKFFTSSGIALKNKMIPMITLASKKWIKYKAGLQQTYRLICSNPVTPLGVDDWKGMKYTHLLNYPSNALEEAQTAATMSGITSRRTQLEVLSVVDDVDEELAEIAKEETEKEDFLTEYGTNRTVDEDDEEEDNTVPGQAVQETEQE